MCDVINLQDYSYSCFSTPRNIIIALIEKSLICVRKFADDTYSTVGMDLGAGNHFAGNFNDSMPFTIIPFCGHHIQIGSNGNSKWEPWGDLKTVATKMVK